VFKQIGDTYKRSFSGLGRESWLLSAVILINRCGNMAVPFMSLYVTQSLKRPPADAGWIITLFGVGAVAGSAFGGVFTDKAGFRRVQLFSLLLSGSFFLVFSVIKDFTILCALAVVISFFSDAFRPANFTAVAAYARPGTETRAYSLNRLATNIGWALGASLGGILSSFSYQLLFVADGASSIIAGLCIWQLLPSVKSVAEKAKKAGQVAVDAVLKPWQDKVYVYFLLVTAVFATSFGLLFRVGPLYFKAVWNMNQSVMGMLMGLNGVLIALFEMVVVNHLDGRRRSRFYIVTGVAIVGFAYLLLLLPAVAAVPALTVSVLLFTAGEMLTLPFINSFVVSRSNAVNRGQYAAGYTLCWSFATVAAPAGGFWLAQHTSYHTLWLTLFTLLLLCALIYRQLFRKHVTG